MPRRDLCTCTCCCLQICVVISHLTDKVLAAVMSWTGRAVSQQSDVQGLSLAPTLRIRRGQPLGTTTACPTTSIQGPLTVSLMSYSLVVIDGHVL